MTYRLKKVNPRKSGGGERWGGLSGSPEIWPWNSFSLAGHTASSFESRFLFAEIRAEERKLNNLASNDVANR